MKYKVKDIFGPTIQGEGTHSGSMVMFLRLTGCNRWSGQDKHKSNSICSFCDTDFLGGEVLTIRTILFRLKAMAETCRTVVISGGEPTLQLDMDLLSYLKNDGWTIHLETNGSKKLGEMRNLIDHITMSPKQSMAETKLERCDDLKILYPWISDDITIHEFRNFNHKQRYIQAIWENKYDDNLKDALLYLYDNPDVRLSVQMHKIIGVE